MSIFNSSAINFKEVMAAVADTVTETKRIEKDCIVSLAEVSLVEHDAKPASIKLKWVNDAKESLFDFRNFNGKTAKGLMKQIQAHVWLLSSLGHNYHIDELNAFSRIEDIIMDMFRKLKGFEGRTIGIEVAHNDESGYYEVTKYLRPSSFVASEEEAYEDDDLPF